MSKLIEGPVDSLLGDPGNRNPGGGIYNGEPGYPKRTGSPDALSEKTLDQCGDFGKAPAQG